MKTHTLTPEERFCLEGCRGYAQYYDMREAFENKFCRFCNIDRKVNDVIYEDGYAMCWAVPEQFMRKEELHEHLLVVPKRHVRHFQELKDEEVLSMHRMRCQLTVLFQIPGGIQATRFGDMSLNAGTVPHLHENIYVPSGKAEFRIPVFKDPTHRAENQKRAMGFATHYEAGEIPP